MPKDRSLPTSTGKWFPRLTQAGVRAAGFYVMNKVTLFSLVFKRRQILGPCRFLFPWQLLSPQAEGQAPPRWHLISSICWSNSDGLKERARPPHPPRGCRSPHSPRVLVTSAGKGSQGPRSPQTPSWVHARLWFDSSDARRPFPVRIATSRSGTRVWTEGTAEQETGTPSSRETVGQPSALQHPVLSACRKHPLRTPPQHSPATCASLTRSLRRAACKAESPF